MNWDNPSWSAEKVTDEKLNARIRDNMLILKEPAHDDYTFAYNVASYGGGGGDWALLDANLELTFDTQGGDVLLLFRAKSNSGFYTFYVDNQNVGGNDGLSAVPTVGGAGGGWTFQMIWLVQDLAAGSHTFAVWSKGGTLRAPVPPNFSAREVS